MGKKIAVLIAAAGFGIFMLLPLLGIIKATNLKKHGVKTEATVVSKKSNKSSNTVTVEFTTSEGTEVTAKAVEGSYVKPGDKVAVWYDTEDPQEIDLGGSQRSNIRAVVIAGLVFVFFIYLFIKYSLTDLANKKLVRTGTKIEADFVAVDRDERIKIKGESPWIIRCSWVDSRNNQKFYFVTKPYTIDPAPYLTGRNHLDVFINPADPKKYFIDTSFMPKGNNTIG